MNHELFVVQVPVDDAEGYRLASAPTLEEAIAMKIRSCKRWLLLAAICAAIGIAGWQMKSTGSERSETSAKQAKALAQELLSRGMQRGKLDYIAGKDLRGSVIDAPTAALMLSELKQTDPDVERLQKALKAVSSRLASLYLRIYADGYMLARDEAEGIAPKSPRKAAYLDDEANLRTIGEVLKAKIEMSHGQIPGMSDLTAYSAYPNTTATSLPIPLKPYTWNPHLAGRRYASFRNPQGQVAVYEDAPVADGKRWVLFLDLKTVKRVGPPEWAKLRRASGIK